MKLLWLSENHKPLPVQKEWLRRRFGEVEIFEDVNSFKNAREIKRRYDAGGYDEILVVAPLSVIDHLCRLGIKPLYAEMKEVKKFEKWDLVYNGRYYRFITIKRIAGIEIKFVEV